MSQITKMSIQGIRSFGPDDQDKQIIAFFAPLTLILGPNGTGKTTIIECLKYMTTGEMPPGGKKDASFIHDPKVAHEPEVKAQIRLMFSDVKGKMVTAQRSLLATQKAKKVEMKTLEGVITRKQADGTKQSITTRCAEMDKEMVSLLGVAKPVLDNVIFCHQEESSWPLSEGKALKQKFDDIFASTRYVKALENIRKFRLEQATDIKQYSAEIKYLKQNKDKAQELRINLEEKEGFHMAAREAVTTTEEKLEPINQKLEQIQHKSNDIMRIDRQIVKLKSEKEFNETALKELQDNIENEFQGTTEELQEMLDEFGNKVKEREGNLRKLEMKIGDLDSQLEKFKQDKSKLFVEQGKLELEAKQHKKNIVKRDEKVSEVADLYGIEGYNGRLSEEQVESFLQILREKAKACIEEAKSRKVSFEEKEEHLQNKIDSQRSQKTKLETEVKMKQQNVKTNEEEVRNIKKKLSEVEASAGRLQDIERDLRRLEMELSDAEKSVNLDALKREITQLGEQKTKLDAELKVLDGEMSRMSRESSVRSELDVLKKDKTTKEDQIKRLCSKNEDSLTYLLGKVPTENCRRTLDEYLRKKTAQVKTTTTELQRMRTRLTELETNRKHQMESLKKKEDEANSYKEKIFTVCESQDLDEGLEDAQENMRKQQDLKGYVQGTEHVYKKYKSQLEKDDPACPLCHRGFDNNSEVDELVDDLSRKLSMVPSKMEQIERKVDEYKVKYENMLQLKPVRSALKDLEEDDVPRLKTKIKALNDEITPIKSKIGESEDSLETLQIDEQTASSMTSDMTLIDRYNTELRDLNRKIQTLSGKLSGGDTNRTMQEVTKEREDIQLQLENINRNIDRKRNRVAEESEHIQQLKSSVNEHKADKLQIESDLQERTRLEQTKTELQEQNDVLQVEIVEAREQALPIQDEIDSLLDQKDQLTQEKERCFEKDKDTFNKMKQNGQTVKQYHEEVESYINAGKEGDLEKSKDKMTRIEKKEKELEDEREEIGTSINKINKDLNMQKVRERELSDNLAIRKKQEDIEKLRGQIEEYKEKLGGLDVNNLVQEKTQLQDEQGDLVAEKHRQQERQRGYAEQIRELKKQLGDSMYKNAEVEYRDKIITLKTTELANQDLDKYYKALDKAIMTYHKSKMDEINKIIRDLWRNTYKGIDIETIEIQSDEEERSASATRRNYNYRVVMKKGDTCLDMRGRCSAGQKVLASLIIRLALAETFCLSCGILALDEPTTNLDRENIESLAYALVEIIKSRAKQRNFQLIIITHDEDFVELLGRSDYVEEFFKVRKNAFGYSQLVRANVTDLHSR